MWRRFSEQVSPYVLRDKNPDSRPQYRLHINTPYRGRGRRRVRGRNVAYGELFLAPSLHTSATPSGRQRLGPIARLSGVRPALSQPDLENCLFAEATMLVLHLDSSD